MKFIQAKNYTKVASRVIELVVLHDMESPEEADTAENVAAWGAGPNAPRASWHYAVDSNSVVQSVLEHDVAWHAPGANHNGIGIEHAGRARQTMAEWLDPFGRSMLALSALLTADILKREDLPARVVGVSGLRAGEKGITTHAAVSKAFGRSNHTDPGVNFPMSYYMGLVEEALRPRPFRNWPVPIPAWFWEWAKWRLQGAVMARPASAPRVIPPWAWTRLAALKRARLQA